MHILTWSSVIDAQFFMGAILSLVVCSLAWKAKALSASGVLPAFFNGVIVFGLGGLAWAFVLLTFFISSSILSRVFSQQKKSFIEKFSKGSQRDWKQVMANGGIGALLVLVYALLGKFDWIWVAFCGAMSAVNADTWATELGVLDKRAPRRISTGARVEAGSSGAISFVGYLSAAIGALLIAIVAWLFSPDFKPTNWIVIISLAGLLGSTIDSFLGDTVQAIYYCDVCSKETEHYPRHRCGAQTRRIRGWSWLDNDWVNFCSSFGGAAIAIILWLCLV